MTTSFKSEELAKRIRQLIDTGYVFDPNDFTVKQTSIFNKSQSGRDTVLTDT